VTVIDDFAHHPTAVEETLKALRMKYDGRRLIAVFEPRSWSSRLAIFQEPYGKAFSYADYVIIAGVYNTSKASELGKVLDTDELVRDIEMQGKPALSFPGRRRDSRTSHPGNERGRCRCDHVERRFWGDTR
jgi:UDP-N-acetylmuramate: L-alanyl-gamma-D-glutamyl-meso-diaminopimelate ligase